MTDFYQSPADKLRFEILLKSLREGSLNLAIVGDDEVALANYGRQIFDHLKDAGEENVEWWSSADSEKLVQRFNDILSELTVDEALDKSQKRSPKRYMIFPDTHAIQDFELQLLARLINGFPTSNINLVLVVNQHDPYEEKLAVFGKNLLQWILESEHPPSVKAPRRSNRIETMDESPKVSPVDSKDAIADFSATFAATLASGKFPGPGESKGPNMGASSIGDVSPNDKNDFDPLMDSPGQGGGNLSAAEDREEKSSLSTKVAGILIFAILATVTAFGLIYKDEVAKEAQSLQDFVSGKKPATAKTAAPAKAAPTEPGASPAASSTAESATTTPVPTDGASTSAASSQTNTATITPLSPSSGAAPTSPATVAPPTAPTTTTPPPLAPTAVTASTANTPTPATSVASSPPRPAPPSTPPSAVGMSSSVKVPVKTDDSLIPNKEVLIVPKAPTTAPAPVTNTAQSSATNVAANNSPGVNAKVGPTIAPAPGASVAPKAEPKTEPKAESKTEPKAETKLEAREVKPTTKELPKESPKEITRDKEKREARETREAKPVAKTVVAKTNEPLPKLDPKGDKADRADKLEESKPKSASSDSTSGFRPRPEDQRWVQGLPEDGWVMQHAALDSIEEAKSFQQSSPFYRDAKVMYTKRKDAPPYYIVVTGPYSSRQDAESETRKHPIMAKSWVRSARSLKNQFED